MIERELKNEILEMAKIYPVVTLIGPRQSGKTLLMRTLFPNKTYVNLENLNDRNLAKEDPESFMERYKDGAIIDEIQLVPELLSYIQVIVDESGFPGQFYLTGSHQFELHQAVSQSLAGRTALLKLWPLSLKELSSANLNFNENENIIKGGYPKVITTDISPDKYYSHYTQTYVEKDVRRLINLRHLTEFQRFMKLVAARVSTQLNLSSIASELGVTSPTVNEWLSVLEASYLIFRLPPYFENFGKRIIKKPKIYFTDTGLVCHLLGIESIEHIDRDPIRGRLFENMVVSEFMKTRINQGKEPNLYYYNEQNQLEIDLLYQQGSELFSIEIKASKTFKPDLLKGLEKFQKISKRKLAKQTLIYSGSQEQTVRNIEVLNYKQIHTVFE